MTGESYIVYNGVDSRTLGVIIVQLPAFLRPQRNKTFHQISGRDGRLTQDDESYDFYQTAMKINCNGQPLSKIYDWLSGEGWMISSAEPDRKMKVDLYYPIRNDAFRCDGCYDTLTVTLYCQPYRYYVEDVTQEVTSSTAILTNPGTAASCPRITIKGSGDVVVLLGEYQMDFEGLTDGVIVDGELMDCLSLDESQLLNGVASMDEFPKLKPGANGLSWTGDVTSVTVEMRCRDL